MSGKAFNFFPFIYYVSKYLKLSSGPVLTIAFGTILVSVFVGIISLASINLSLALGSFVGIIAHITAYLTAARVNPYRTDNPIRLPSFRLIDLDIFFNPKEGIPRWIREQMQWISILIIAIPFAIGPHLVLSEVKTVFGLSSAVMNMYYILVIGFALWMGERLICQYGSRLFTEGHSRPVES